MQKLMILMFYLVRKSEKGRNYNYLIIVSYLHIHFFLNSGLKRWKQNQVRNSLCASQIFTWTILYVLYYWFGGTKYMCLTLKHFSLLCFTFQEFNNESLLAQFYIDSGPIRQVYRIADDALVEVKKNPSASKKRVFDLPKSIHDEVLVRPKIDTCFVLTDRSVYRINVRCVHSSAIINNL